LCFLQFVFRSLTPTLNCTAGAEQRRGEESRFTQILGALADSCLLSLSAIALWRQLATSAQIGADIAHAPRPSHISRAFATGMM
jgi:hypothetical protein